jgi:cytochrome bd-type quinol oxidase subunit 2
MNAEVITRRRNIVVKAAGALFGLFGLFLIAVIAWPLRNFTWGWDSAFFMLAFPIPGVALGCYCIFAAYKTWCAVDVSIEDVRRMSLIAAILLALTVGACAVGLVNGSGCEGLLGPVVMVAGGAIYLMSVRWLARWLGLGWETDWRERERAARSYFWVLAVISFAGVAQVAMEVAPKDESYEHVPKQPWGYVALFGSLLLAMVLYYACTHVALRGKPKESSVISRESWNEAQG